MFDVYSHLQGPELSCGVWRITETAGIAQALTAKRGWLTSIVVLIGITYRRRSYKITSPNVSRYIKWLKILLGFLKAADR